MELQLRPVGTHGCKNAGNHNFQNDWTVRGGVTISIQKNWEKFQIRPGTKIEMIKIQTKNKNIHYGNSDMCFFSFQYS